jgi:glutamate/tyrosine decarboxylase-like PLP-dependent enzyme
MDPDHPLLSRTLEHAGRFLDGLPHRPVGNRSTASAVRRDLSEPLADEGIDAVAVIDELVAAVEPGLVASAGPRYFGFVTGGALPAALAADWLTATWDQNGALETMSPAAAAAEAVTLDWVRDLLGLDDTASGAIVGGAQAGNTVGITVARDELLRRQGWDTRAAGLAGSPPITVIAGAGRHLTIDRALRFAGLGQVDVLVSTHDDATIDVGALRAALDDVEGPVLVCVQAGNMTSGGFDDFNSVIAASRRSDAWVHVDGAFGLWASVSPTRRHLTSGVQGADSWVVDGHKWLNTPYDGAFVYCADADAHRRSMLGEADYLPVGERRDPMHWSQDFSRRARSFALYAALRSLGRNGVAELVDRCCALAADFAARLDGHQGLTVRNDVVLNQVIVDAGSDDRVQHLIRAVQDDGTCWMGPTTWQGSSAVRISVSNWSTTAADIQRSADAVLAAAQRI